MGQKHHKPEEIVAKLRQVEVLTSQGRSIAEAVRSIEVSEQTYFRWRAEYGGMKTDQLKRLKELELENARLRRAVSDLTLDKLILKEAARGNFFSIRGSLINSFSCSSSTRKRRSCGALASLRGRRRGRLMMGSEGVGGAI